MGAIPPGYVYLPGVAVHIAMVRHMSAEPERFLHLLRSVCTWVCKPDRRPIDWGATDEAGEPMRATVHELVDIYHFVALHRLGHVRLPYPEPVFDDGLTDQAWRDLAELMEERPEASNAVC